MKIKLLFGIENFQARFTRLKNPPVRFVQVIVRLPFRPVIFPANRARRERRQLVPVHETHVIAQNVLRLEQFQANAAAQAQYFPMQTQNVHLEFDFRRQRIGAKLTDVGVCVIGDVLDEVEMTAEDVAAHTTEQVTVGMREADVSDDFALALRLLLTYFALIFRMIVHEMLG